MKIKDLCFEIIQKCPNNCLFCSSESNFDKCNIVDFETFKKTIKHFISLGGIEEISFSGGEPMLHPNIYDMVEFCSNLGIKTTDTTIRIKFNIVKNFFLFLLCFKIYVNKINTE